MAKEFPVATIKRIMKDAGVERASDEAAEELSEVLNEVAMDISQKALNLMFHAKRKTVTEEDVRLAAST